eukprot:TRINITY_DN32433_c0_g1_i1.p1 TRINITY_DN32433_c0_g1~~TRINITY_DN32433_c0_g1_i1.p1  ORF type:complete len:1965 (-),score=463.32 TRINITY_DN32433_c0_g1_i1:238-5751(-)
MYSLEHFDKLLPGLDRVVAFLSCVAGLGQAAAEGRRKEQVPRFLTLLKSRPADHEASVAFFQMATEFLLIPSGSTEAPSVGGLPSTSWSHWKSRLKSKSSSDMVTLKCSVLRWLGSMGADPPASLVYLPSLVASVENYDTVCNMAESNCKRLDPELDLNNDLALLGRLTCAALTNAPPGHEASSGVLKVEPKATVPAKLRHKVLSLLQRSWGIGKTEMVVHVVHLIKQSLRESEQVQQSALQLALVLAEHVDPENLVETSQMLLTEIESVFWPGGGVVAMGTATPLAFKTFGSFARQLAERPSGEGRALALRSAPRMLALLASNENAAQDILEALGGLVACMRGTGEEERKDFVPLLDRLITAPRAVVRREVLRWSSTLFPASAPEGRYYALRLLGDQDPDLAKSAESALSAGGREAPPFAEMCSFLASRALGLGSAKLQEGRLISHSKALLAAAATAAPSTPALPALTAGFSRRDLARALSFLLRLAEAEGLRAPLLAGSMEPAAKKPRLGEKYSTESLIAFLALLDYLLGEVVEGSSAAVTDEAVDGMTCLELSLEGLLLAASLSQGHQSIYCAVVSRAEVVLLGSETSDGNSRGTLFRSGSTTANRMRRLGARVLGALAHQPSTDENACPGEKWLRMLSPILPDSASKLADDRAGGAALAMCELLREGVGSAEDVKKLCRQVLGLLLLQEAADTATLSAACDGLRRLSEKKALVWEAMDDTGSLSRDALLERIKELSAPVTESLGDTKELELGRGNRDLIHASWRLLGQLAAWGVYGFDVCIDKLIDIGLKSPGEEATASLGMALCAAASDPTEPLGQAAASRTEKLMLRLLKLAGEDKEQAEADEKEMKQVEDGVESLEKKRALAAKRDSEQRCGVVWLAVLLRQLSRSGLAVPLLPDTFASLGRALVRSVGGLSIFVADCGIKSLCHLYRLAPTDHRAELLKGLFASVSNRTVVSNMFVGTADTQAQKEEKEKREKEGGGPNSLKIAAKERIDQMKDLMFLARELQHPPLFIGLLDQPVGSVWTGEVLREALDLQASCLPAETHSHLCPAALRPKLYTYLFHPNAPLRQSVVALTANYFGCESPQALASKHPEEWQPLAKNLVQSLGSARVNTREAGVQAAQALFRGRTWLEVEFILDDLWTIVVKLMDDMEPKIQALVKPLVRMIRNLTLRLCDQKVTPKREVEAAMNVVVPLLLKFCERYKHAQPVCFDVMRELIKGAQGTSMLTPHVQNLIPPLLVSLSMLENDALQYYQFHVNAASEEKGKELEAARISNSRDSESMKLLRQLVPLITEECAEALAPRTRDSLHRGVGANTRVGVCDFWVAVCAERPSSVPIGGTVVTSMLRSVAGALLDPSREVRGAAASCFASFARRNTPQELTKVVFERLLKHEQEFRTDDAQRNSYRVALARALWEVCRRCDDATLEAELKAAIAAKAFGLRWSSESEVKTGWESLWGELCPTTSGGTERYAREICKELAGSLEESASRADKVDASKAVSALASQLEKVSPRPQWSEDEAVKLLHRAVKEAVQTLPVFDGSGALVRALADLSAVMHRRKRGDASTGAPADEEALGLPLILGFCSKGSLTDRGAAAQALLEVTAATRLWPTLPDAEKLYKIAATHVDDLQKEDEKEEREPGVAPPKRHRGKGSSPAEELLSATLDFWATCLQQCRREVKDENDLEPPEGEELAAFVGAGLEEFSAGSLTIRLSIVRFWKHVFTHLASERLPLKSLSDELCGKLAAAVQDASLDARSERLRRPALELTAALIGDTSTGGGRETLQRGLAAEAAAAAAEGEGAATARASPIPSWLERLDHTTAELCAKEVAALRSIA